MRTTKHIALLLSVLTAACSSSTQIYDNSDIGLDGSGGSGGAGGAGGA